MDTPAFSQLQKITIKENVFAPPANNPFYDPLCTYMDFYVDCVQDALDRYGRNYKQFIINIASQRGYSLFVIYLKNGVRMARIA